MNPRFTLCASAALLALSLTGCQHSLVVKVDLYQPKLREWDLDEKSRQENCHRPPLTKKEERVLAMLKEYRRENPSPRLPERYPASDLVRVLDQVTAHEVLAQDMVEAFMAELYRERVEPARRTLELALTRLENIHAETAVGPFAAKLADELRAAEAEAASARAALDLAPRATARAQTPPPAVKVPVAAAPVTPAAPVPAAPVAAAPVAPVPAEQTRARDTLFAARESVRSGRDQLQQTRDAVAQTRVDLLQAWRTATTTARDAIGKARLKYQDEIGKLCPIPPLGKDPEAAQRARFENNYREAVRGHLEKFTRDFWTVVTKPGLVPADALDLRVPVQGILREAYRLDRQDSALVRELVPPEIVSTGAGPNLTPLVGQLNLAPPAPVQKTDDFRSVLSDPLIALAESDPEGWQSTPSLVRHDTNSKADLLIVRETPAEYHAVALREKTSDTVNASMRLAVATTAVVMEVAQTVAGLNLGFSPPAGGIPDAPPAADAESLRRDVSPWTAATLRSLARARAERVQSLLQRVPTQLDLNAPEWQAWNAEAKALLDSHPRIETPAKPAQ